MTTQLDPPSFCGMEKCENPLDLGKNFLSGHESHPLSQLTQDF